VEELETIVKDVLTLPLELVAVSGSLAKLPITVITVSPAIVASFLLRLGTISWNNLEQIQFDYLTIN
ncbi:hypothetical protein QP671_28905, partial [Klebsiella pneumoniae]|nr:hypothetical protein [Klebsiella pneumoniae]